MEERLTITDVAKEVGVTPRTIMRWEKTGKVKKPKRDWRGWRFYTREMLEEIKSFYESSYEYDELDRSLIKTAKDLLIVILAATYLLSSSILCAPAFGDIDERTNDTGIVETSHSVNILLDELPTVDIDDIPIEESVKYTLGPKDVIQISVRRHPEFSGKYAINSEGKIEYKYVGDIIVSGLTKPELKDRLTTVLSEYLIEPDIDVRILAYLSKVIYVVGEVGRPGKFYMRGDTIKTREALIQAGLPTHAAAMRRCRIITPGECDKDNYVEVNIYKLLYEGDLRQNMDMQPGDVLYIPATMMAKIIRVISPVTNAFGQATGTATKAAAAAAL